GVTRTSSSNCAECRTLEHAPGVQLRFVDRPEGIAVAALVILPGTKRTTSDLAWLRERGFATSIQARVRNGAPVLGICGGCQMLGQWIKDPEGVESSETVVPGLGLLPLRTLFKRQKITAQVRARATCSTFLTQGVAVEISGYEIHMGV